MVKYALVLVCLLNTLSLKALALDLPCNQALIEQKPLVVSFGSPQGKRIYKIFGTGSDAPLIEQFLIPYLRDFSEKERALSSIKIRGRELPFKYLSGMKIIKGELNLVLKDNFEKTHLITASDVDEINLVYDDSGKVLSILRPIGRNMTSGLPLRK